MVNEGCVPASEFLVKTAEFFKLANEKHIAVRLTAKRLIKVDEVDGNDEFNATELPKFDISRESSLKTDPEAITQEQYSLLIRISFGSHAKKTKCSTVVSAADLDKFWQEYSSVVKTGMVGLVKKKKKRKGKNVVSKDKKKKAKK
ncbi:RNA-binding signal recognition particle subunit SRP14 KNAG_0A05750 [Huiozyma naganishii CBS 8797]|uniref:Signal recognition particle subunit SRP14 n=1 Tax=Huiozyma naganishii (strain ATCC MYA-139 / BCRC 22969 / CBS 8797 / KCTC 17520 / NBRC 10181 / NCYC 3082 / Yp74L-3) TaxID=1071383 RepID=J7RFA1_HUIN7|nr:hypothetical protein KNAG_0A05750 [Kazachstania naganishii CBS 8797]CCK68238.1 hypothetical protein KNAG_0A05750 [Kazachstania naganishii CBS 8797]